MTIKLKNSLLAGLFLWAGKATEGEKWVVFNEFVRKFYLSVFCPSFAWFLKRDCFENHLRLIPRHSVKESGSFNAFFSDLDFSIVFEREPSPVLLGQVLKSYSKCSKIFPFIGELEIYTGTEWSSKVELATKHAATLDLIWNLRKWSWQRQILLEAPSAYHKYKAHRSIRRIREKLNLPPEIQFPSLSFNSLLARIISAEVLASAKDLPSVFGKSAYLGWELSGICPLFVAILPDGHWSCSDPITINRLREIGEVGQKLRALCEFDLLMLQSRTRAYSIQPDKEWKRNLDVLLQRFSS